MTNRRLVVPLSLVLVLAGALGQGALTGQASSSPKHKPAFAIKATLTAGSVKRDDQEQLSVHTVSHAVVAIQVKYPEKGGFHTHGKTNAKGRWQHKWQIHADYPGAGSVALLVIKGAKHRNYTVHFNVLPIATATPTATQTPTIVPTATATSTPTSEITLGSLQFYTATSGPDQPSGSPQTSFPDTTATIYAFADFSAWYGNHAVTITWTDPAGNTYSTSGETTTQEGTGIVSSQIDVAGQPAAGDAGNWTVTVTADGRQAGVEHFALVSTGTATPTATATAGPTATGTVTATATGTTTSGTGNTSGLPYVTDQECTDDQANGPAPTLQSFQLYSSVDANGQTVGSPITTISSTAPSIYAYATFSAWQGCQTLVYTWTDQSGDPPVDVEFDSSSHSGAAVSYNGEPIVDDGQGGPSPFPPGQYTVTLLDWETNTQLGSLTFTVTP
ncbi:MAG: hypothetical protein ACRDFS_04695 [Chloroflexota bacterium]